ncbi:MAG: flagellar hook-basal body complex protein FliE [Thermoleophilaceae bacterium]|jgi:flagellar hook-basal body complex protein FliE|nr:flagellar hook-basal body complex protein FliE [Thermoleophilaceae bacterium]
MAIVPVDPSMMLSASERAMGTMPPVDAPAQGAGQGFGGMLSNAISSLEKTQTDAASASQALANGTATDPTQVVTAVERARLSMQLASQIRSKAVEAYTDVFHTQV